jgi:PAS domain S-box-containing protein
MPRFDALAALTMLKESGRDVPFIIISGTIGEDLAVEAMRSGAADYLMKDNLARLVPTIERELHETEHRRARRLAEAALRESEDRYRDLVEHSNDLICTHDLEGRVLSVNQAAARTLGYPRTADLIGRNLREALLPEFQGKYADYIAQLQQTGSAHGLMAVVGANGERRIWEYNNTLRTEGVVFPIVRGLAHDVTERKKTEKALRHSEEHYRILFNSNPQPMWAYDVETRMLRRLIGEDIDLSASLAPDLGQVKVDPGQIDQVIINLIANARDAMPAGGKLTIETANATLDDDYCHDHIPCVLGKGTTFKIYLPRADEAVETETPTGLAKLAPHGTETILLVEDEEQVRQVAQQILTTLGYTVLPATNGQEALAVARQHSGTIDLTITDVVMPQLSGRELIERLVPLRPEMKVIFMSGYTDDAIVRHGLLDERLEFIQKPFAADAFARKIRSVLDQGESRVEVRESESPESGAQSR